MKRTLYLAITIVVACCLVFPVLSLAKGNRGADSGFSTDRIDRQEYRQERINNRYQYENQHRNQVLEQHQEMFEPGNPDAVVPDTPQERKQLRHENQNQIREQVREQKQDMAEPVTVDSVEADQTQDRQRIHLDDQTRIRDRIRDPESHLTDTPDTGTTN